MCGVVSFFEQFQCFAGFESVALPAASKALFLGAFFYFAAGPPAAFSAGVVFAANFHHRAQKLVAFVIMFECFEGGYFGEHCGMFTELLAAKVVSQVFCEVGDFLRMAGTIGAIGATISDKVCFLRHRFAP